MTFTVSRKALLDELALLQTVAERKTTIPVLSYLMIGLVGTTLSLTATDMDVSLETELEAVGDSWGGCLPSAQLYALVKLLYDDRLTFTLKDTRMEIKAGRARHLLPVLPISEFPDVDRIAGEGVTLDASIFRMMLDHVVFAVLPPSDNHNQSSHRFTGVNISLKDSLLQLAATNITRFATVSQRVESDVAFNVIIPQQALGALATMSKSELIIGASENHAHFTNGKRHLYSRLIDGKFPDWKALFPVEYEHEAQLSTAELGGAIKRALLTSTEGKFVRDGLRCTWANDELLIETRGGDKGKSDEVVTAVCPSVNGQPIVLGLNGQQVVDVLSLLGEQAVCRFSAGTNIVELRPAQPTFDFTYYLNTVSLKNWQ